MRQAQEGLSGSVFCDSVGECDNLRVMGGNVPGANWWQQAACAFLIVTGGGCSDETSTGPAFTVDDSGVPFVEPPTDGRPPPPAPTDGRLPMFVAQGHAGRTTLSCDDGRTWVEDRSDEAWDYCSSNDCDHGPGAGRGITWGEGWFFATFGWGSPRTLRRSMDGVNWQVVLDGETFGGVAYGNSRLVAASRNGQYSDDQGETWQDFTSVALTTWNVRDTAFVPYDGGRFIMTTRDETSEVVVSSDGAAWTQPQTVPTDCQGGSYQGRVVHGNGTTIMIGQEGVVCRSSDGGQTWFSTPVANSLGANGIWSGHEFMTWHRGTLHRSTDGETWTTTETVPEDVDIGVAAVSDEGTIVGVTNGWQQHYDSQKFYRSEDGVHWEVLPRDAYTGGHPIKTIAFGYGEPSEHCQ